MCAREKQILVAKVKKEQLQSSPLRTSPRIQQPPRFFLFLPFECRERARFVFEKTDLHSLCASGEGYWDAFLGSTWSLWLHSGSGTYGRNKIMHAATCCCELLCGIHCMSFYKKPRERDRETIRGWIWPSIKKLLFKLTSFSSQRGWLGAENFFKFDELHGF